MARVDFGHPAALHSAEKWAENEGVELSSLSDSDRARVVAHIGCSYGPATATALDEWLGKSSRVGNFVLAETRPTSVWRRPNSWLSTIVRLMGRNKLDASVGRLVSESAFKRRVSGETTILSGPADITIRPLVDSQDPLIDRVQGLLEKTFGSEEVDPVDVLRAEINGVNQSGQPVEVDYRVFAATNVAGDLVHAVLVGLLPLRDEMGKSTGEFALMEAYTVTDKGERLSGVAREAYVAVLQDARSIADAKGGRVVGSFCEAVETSEAYHNKIGMRRVYLKSPEGRYTEVPYMQAPLDFDLSTGEVAEGAGSVPEHLMCEMFGHTMERDDVLRMVRAAYRWQKDGWPQDKFDSQDAFERSREHYRRLEGNLVEFLSRPGEIVLLSHGERNALKARGKMFTEVVA